MNQQATTDMDKITTRVLLAPLSLRLLDDGPVLPDSPSTPDNAGSDPGHAGSFPLLPISFSLSAENPAAYGDGVPKGKVEFAVPSDDMPRVQAWFSGDYHNVTIPQSATLTKNMTAAVTGTLNSYLSAAENADLFAAPFRLGWRYRLFDGSVFVPGDGASESLLTPLPEVLLLRLSGYSIGDRFLSTDVDILGASSRLRFACGKLAEWKEFEGIITAVEFYITKPAALFSPTAAVNGLRNVDIDGVRTRIWHYDTYTPSQVEAAARADTDFRIVATLPFADFTDGFAERDFPLEAGTLMRFASLPRPDSGSGGSGSGTGGVTGDGEGWKPWLHFETPPLDLGRPEEYKRVTDLYLRGVFGRKDVEIALYGSRHRDDWRLLARSRGPYIRGLRGVPCRWLKAEIATPMRLGDFLEALTFRYFLIRPRVSETV